MIGLVFAMLTALLSGLIGIGALISTFLAIRGAKKKNELYLYGIITMLCLSLCLSFCICTFNGEHLNSNFTKNEFPIEKLTTKEISFDGKTMNIFDTGMNIEKSHNQLQDVVIEERENYELQWIWKVKMSTSEYHVHLSKENYERLQDAEIIYEKK